MQHSQIDEKNAVLPKISVVVPIYKVQDYLTECVDSIINQTYKNLEIILVDDGSPDECPKMCDEFALRDRRIRVVHKKNGGLSDARNAGIDIATGEFITFIDSDDVVDSRMLSILFDNITDSVSISCCGYCDFNSELPTVSTISSTEYCDFHSFAIKPVYVTAWAKLYKLSLFDDIRYPIGRLHEDEFITYKLLDKSQKIAYTSTPMYFYRKRGDSIVANMKEKNNIDRTDAYLERADYFYKKSDWQQFGESIKIACYILLDVLNYKCVSKETKKNYKTKILQFDLKKIKGTNKIKIWLFLHFPNVANFLQTLKNIIKGNKL